MALTLPSNLIKTGILKKYNVKLIGTQIPSIMKAEDRELFKETMENSISPFLRARLWKALPRQGICDRIGYPLIVRPAYTLGGTGGGIAHNDAELDDICTKGLQYSLIGQVLIERSVAGWKEIEFEVIRDHADNCITVCNMENLDPVGVHTGDSIVVAPCQTLTDREVQMLRTAAIDIVRELGVEGGCNVHVCLNPDSRNISSLKSIPASAVRPLLLPKQRDIPLPRWHQRLLPAIPLMKSKMPLRKRPRLALNRPWTTAY